MKKFCVSAMFLLPFIFGGCAEKVSVTLLPEEGGKVGKIGYIDKEGKTKLIDKAWETLEIKKDGSVSSGQSDEKTVMAKYGDTIAAMPQKPLSFLIFFGSESADIGLEDMKILGAAIEAIKTKKANLVVCAGHTDSSGQKDYNRALSLKRAENVAKYLIKHGVDKNLVEVKYYGDADPLVKTANGTHSPKNRRVEIIVR